ncbi:hypothetical protein BO70DRAFT_429543 [Aspergillus heteromorphus CBS 117.55]|uniref:Uncharacterized protein n=1 Tax=Aspergillus heteromorphus CBS 117.55 TaxID=1448321 RepID=A0A317W5K0_9EURO|nr:uncharacterized protein BO70DRAFT_429543 [Aspergillus heteromorphus CBS 117.55]PWY80507.1 hypothetical protein BO70DRAFT_429543 [Aspergillus heteromorphus CBS 117.55]
MRVDQSEVWDLYEVQRATRTTERKHHTRFTPYIVIRFVTTPETGGVQIPALLRGETSVPSDSELGYSRGVAAIILGNGYDDSDIQMLRKAAKDIKPMPWLQADGSKPTPPLGPEYGKALVERIKSTVKELQEKGAMDEDAAVYY